MNDTVTVSELGMVANFYESKMGRFPTPQEALFALKEELMEFLESLQDGSTLEQQLKEAMDVRYTIDGWCLANRANATEAFQRVHTSNMLKPKTSSGKIPKGPDYIPPDLGDCIG